MNILNKVRGTDIEDIYSEIMESYLASAAHSEDTYEWEFCDSCMAQLISTSYLSSRIFNAVSIFRYTTPYHLFVIYTYI